MVVKDELITCGVVCGFNGKKNNPDPISSAINWKNDLLFFHTTSQPKVRLDTTYYVT